MKILLFRTIGILHPTEAKVEGGLDIETTPAVDGFLHLHGNGLDRSVPLVAGRCHIPPESVFSCAIRIVGVDGREWRTEGWNVAGRVITPKGFKERRVYAEILDTMEEQSARLDEINKRLDEITDCLGMPIPKILDLS